MFWLQHAGPGHAREFSSSWEDRLGMLANVYYYVVVGTMVLGLPFWFRRVNARHVLLWGPFALYTAMWAVLFVGEARYHFPLLPIFAVLAAIGLSAALQKPAARGRSTPAL
jgi:hypothetical protein